MVAINRVTKVVKGGRILQHYRDWEGKEMTDKYITICEECFREATENDKHT